MMDDHTVVITLEYHAMAETCFDAVERAFKDIRTGGNSDLLPLHMRTSCCGEYSRQPAPPEAK